MHPKATSRLFLLAVVVVTAGGSIGGLVAYRKMALRTEFAKLRTDGLADAAAGRNETALVKLKRYFSRFPDDAEALSAFAGARLEVPLPRGGHITEAANALNRVVNVDPARTADRARLAGLLCDIGRLPDALDQADRTLAVEPQNTAALRVRSTTLSRMRRDKEAYTASLAWAKAAPEDMRAALAALTAAKQSGVELPAMTSLAKSLEERSTSEVGKPMIRATLAALKGDSEACRRDLLVAIQLPIRSRDEVQSVATLLQGLGMATEAAEYMIRAAEQNLMPGGKTDPARILFQINRYDLLSKLLNDVQPDAAAKSPELVGLKAIALLAIGQPADGRKFIDALVAAAAAPGASGLVTAWAVAVQINLGIGQITPEKAIQTLSDPANMGESSPLLILVLADAYSRIGETDRASTLYDALAVRAPAWAVPLARKARLLAAKGQLTTAMECAEAAFRRNNRDLSAVTTLADVWAANVDAGIRNDKTQLDQFLKSLTEVLPNDQGLLASRVNTLARTGRKPEALSVIDNLMTSATKKPGPTWAPVLQRVSVASAANGLGREDTLLALSEQMGGMTPEIALTRALLKLGTLQTKDVLAAFDAAAAKSASDTAAARNWAVARARLLDAVADPAATTEWVKTADTFAQDASIQREAAASPAVRRDFDFRSRAVERLKTLGGPQSNGWRLADASLALDRAADTKELTRVAESLNDFLKQSPGSVDARYRLALCLDRLGGTSAAIEQLRTANQMSPDSIPVALLLSELLQRRGNFADAARVLDRAASGRINDEGQRRLTAALLAQQGEPERALELISKSGANAGGDLLMARLYRQQNDLARAEAEARAAVASRPEVGSIRLLAEVQRATGHAPEAMQTLALLKNLKLDPGIEELALTQFHLGFMDLRAALVSAQSAADKAPSNPQAWQTLITVQAASGDLEGAVTSIQKAAGQLPKDPTIAQQTQLIPLVRQAAGDAVLRVALPDVLQHPEDPSLQELVRTPTSGSPADGGPSAAINRTRQLAAKYPLSLPVQMFATRRLLQFGVTDEAAQIASRATQSFPTAIEPAAVAANTFAAAANWDQALGYARLWRARSAANPMPADMAAAEALIRVKRYKDVFAVVQPYVVAFASDPAGSLPAVFRKAEAESFLNRETDSLRTLQPVLAGKPEAWAAWLDFCASRMPPEKTVAWAGRAESSPEGKSADVVWAVAKARAAALSESRDPSAGNARAALAALAGENAGHALEAALVCDQANDLKTAESLYRKAVSLGADIPAARNNLAMVLVRQGASLDDALAMAEAAVAKQPLVGAFLDTQASVHVARKEFDKADEAMRKAISLEPTAMQWWVHLAEIQVKAGNLAGAKETINAARPALLGNPSADLKARVQTIDAATQAASAPK